MLMYAIPAYRLPKDLIRRLIGIFKNMGVTNSNSPPKVGDAVMPEANLRRSYDSVLYATGTWKRPVMGISGEELTVFGLDFLVEIKKWMEGQDRPGGLRHGRRQRRHGRGDVGQAPGREEGHAGLSRAERPHARELRRRSRARRRRASSSCPAGASAKVFEENGVVKGMQLKRCTSPWDENGAFNPQYDACEVTVCQSGKHHAGHRPEGRPELLRREV